MKRSPVHTISSDVAIAAADATDNDDQIIEILTINDEFPLPVYGLGGNDLIYVLATGDWILGSGDYGDVSITPGTFVDFGNDIIFVNGSDLYYGVTMNGDADEFELVSGFGLVAYASSGSDVLVNLGDAASLNGDAGALDMRSAVGGTTVFTAGWDVLMGNGRDRLVGDVLNAYMFFTSADTVHRANFGSDYLTNAYYAHGDTAYLAIDVDRRLAGTEADVNFGDDVIEDSVEMCGDSETIILRYDYAPETILIEFGDDQLVGSDKSELLIGDSELISFSWNNIDNGLSGSSFQFGDDTLISGSASEIMIGDYGSFVEDYVVDIDPADYANSIESGTDTFIFEGDFGNDVILDFETGKDMIVLEGFDWSQAHLISAYWANGTDDLVIDMTALGGGTLTIEDVADISESDFIFA